MSDFLSELATVIEQRRDLAPAESYVAAQLNAPLDEFYRKLPEEATETVLACATGADRNKITAEAADVLFQLLLVLAKHEISIHDVIAELQSRRNTAEVA